MTRFKQFLTENTDLNELYKKIKLDCSYFLEHSNDKYLVRGINDAPSGFSKHPLSRMPRDTTQAFNWFYNLCMDATFGINTIRQHTVFCTGNFKNAAGYGAVHFIFPKGNFKFLCSERSVDSGDDFNLNMLFHSKLFDAVASYPIQSEQDLESFFELLSFEYPNPREWLHSKNNTLDNEIFQTATGSPLSIPNLKDKIVHSLTKLTHMYYPDISLSTAINSGSEVLIYESEGYYHIKVADIIHQMNEPSPSIKEVYAFLLSKIAKS